MSFWKKVGGFLSAPLKVFNPNNYLHGNPVDNIFGTTGKIGLGMPEGTDKDALNFLEMVPFIGDAVTAQKNRDLTRETNQLNYQMFQEQNAFNEEQARLAFQRESAYNSEAAQVARMKQAGINPAVAFGQSTGVSSPSASAGSPIPMDAPISNFSATRSFDATMNGIAQGENLKAIAETVKGLNVDNETRKLYFDILKDTMQYQKDSIYWSSEQVKEQVRKMAEETTNLAFERDYKNAILDLQKQEQSFKEKQHVDSLLQFKEQNKVDLMNARANLIGANAAYMQGKLSEKQFEFQKEQARKEYINAVNQRINNYCNELRKHGLEEKKVQIARDALEHQKKRDILNFFQSSVGTALGSLQQGAKTMSGFIK